MKYLLDTCTFIWWLDNPTQLSPTAITEIADPGNEVLVSVVSIWEMELKSSLGKLTLFGNLKAYLDVNLKFDGIKMIELTRDHVHEVSKLPFHHKDPFDRILISQAIREGLTIISPDHYFVSYPPPVLW